MWDAWGHAIGYAMPMSRFRTAAATLVLALATLPTMLLAQATPTPPSPRLGVFFWHDSPNDLATFDGIQRGLALAGLQPEYVIERAGGDANAATAALRKLRSAGCELHLALGTEAALRAHRQLPDQTVVFAAVSDPVATGIVRSWDGSGHARLCGASNAIEPANVLAAFRLAMPELRRLGVLRSTTTGIVSQAEVAAMRQYLLTAKTPPLELVEAIVADAGGLGAAAADLLQRDVQAIWIPIDLVVYQQVPAIQQALGERRLPLLTTAASAMAQGAIAGAVPDYALHGRRTAALVLRVLRGAAAGEQPIDRMRSHRLVVNLEAARRNRIELPLSLLALADELLEPDQPNATR